MKIVDLMSMEEFKKNIEKCSVLVTHGGVSALINCYFNDSLYDGPLSNKFLNNCEIACYDTNNFKKIKKL